ncbi:MAG TPA: SIMPL domain-containing protein [Bryobacteraceae bacterium]|nr:SIMPL domain-containing protein [Bryobacteraceae bacterium]
MPKLVLMMVLSGLGLCAQGTTVRPSVRAAGQASVFMQPDQVKIDAGVVSPGTTAQDAAAQNANQVAAVVAALQKLLGTGADIKTINYYVTPVYKSGTNGAPPTIVGYTASLTVEVTMGSVSMAGAVIDTAAAAGATSVGSLQFSLKDPEPARLQALRMAVVAAKNHADAMAGGLGHTTGAIQTIQESSTVNVPIAVGITGVAGGAGAATQITPGLIEVQGSVVLQADLN